MLHLFFTYKVISLASFVVPDGRLPSTQELFARTTGLKSRVVCWFLCWMLILGETVCWLQFSPLDRGELSSSVG